MTETITTINLFYPLLFLIIAIITITIGIVISKNIGNKTFTNVFYKSNDNAKDVTLHVTDKITESLPREYEKEMHALEANVKTINDKLIETTEDINLKLDLLIKRVAEIEKIKYNKNSEQ